jgi:hypothetical protein
MEDLNDIVHTIRDRIFTDEARDSPQDIAFGIVLNYLQYGCFSAVISGLRCSVSFSCCSMFIYLSIGGKEFETCVRRRE